MDSFYEQRHALLFPGRKINTSFLWAVQVKVGKTMNRNFHYDVEGTGSFWLAWFGWCRLLRLEKMFMWSIHMQLRETNRISKGTRITQFLSEWDIQYKCCTWRSENFLITKFKKKSKNRKMCIIKYMTSDRTGINL